MSSSDVPYNGDEYTIFTRVVDNPHSRASAFDRLHQLFLRIASAPSEFEVVDNMAGFIRAILLTAIIQNDMDIVQDDHFFELCHVADIMSTSICVPGSEPWITTMRTDAFIVKAQQYIQYWQDISAFQLNRSKAVAFASSLLNDYDQELKEQTCRMYNPHDIDETDGLRDLLDLLQRSDDFIAREYINSRFGDVISHSMLPHVDSHDVTTSSTNEDFT